MPHEINHVDLDVLKTVLRDHLPIEIQAKILKDIEQAAKDDASAEEGAQPEENKEKPPKVPKKTIVLITGVPPGTPTENLRELGGFLCEIPENMPAAKIPEHLKQVASEYASSRKARKNPAKTTGELWENAPTKLFKSYQLGKKSKGAVEFFVFTGPINT